MSVISTDDVRQVARLARIHLDAAALAAFSAQLDEILGYVKQLQAVPTDAVAPTSHVVPLTNVLRADVHVPSMVIEAALQLAPARHGQLVKVPKVVDAS
jgi:aspartyl-tRNA(Asn)/glutamyl-tRNA(Gln) amidotransferase subunit C